MLQTLSNVSNTQKLEPVARRTPSEDSNSSAPETKEQDKKAPAANKKKLEPVKRREKKGPAVDLFGFEDFVSEDTKKKLKPISEFVLTPGNYYGLVRGSQTYTAVKTPILNLPQRVGPTLIKFSKIRPSSFKIAQEFVKSEGPLKVGKMGAFQLYNGGKDALFSSARFTKDIAVTASKDIFHGGMAIMDYKFAPITYPMNFVARTLFSPVKGVYQIGKAFAGNFRKFGVEKTYVVKNASLFRTTVPVTTENGILNNELIRAVPAGERITQVSKPVLKSNLVLETNGFVKGNEFVSMLGAETEALKSGSRFRPVFSAPEDGVVFLKNSRWNRIAGKFGKSQIFNVKQGDVIPGRSTFYKLGDMPAESDYFIRQGTKIQNGVYLDQPMPMPAQRDGWVLSENAPGKTVSIPLEPPKASGFTETLGKIWESPIKTITPAISEWHASSAFKTLGAVGLVASIYGMVSSVREDGDAINSADPQIRAKKRGYAIDAGDYIPGIGKGWNFGIGHKTVVNIGGLGGAIIGSQIGGYLGGLLGVAVGGIGGGAAGIETGPGAVVTAAAGGLTAGAIGVGVGEFVGGAVGYWGGSTLTEHIWTATLGEDS